MKVAILILTFIPHLTNAQNYTKVNKCNNDMTLPKVRIYTNNKLCDASPCPIGSFSKTVVTMDFISPHVIEKLSPILTAEALGMKINVPDNMLSEICINLENTYCPLAEGELTSYKCALTLPFIPVSHVTLSFAIKDDAESNNGFTCFSTDLTIGK